MKFTDTVALAGTRRTSDGYLVTQARAVRTGIQIYTGAEMGLVDRDFVRVYRPESEVRSPASLQSFSHAPVTMGHPENAVTAENWKDLAIGEVSTAAEWDDGHISLPLILKDADAISQVEAGTRELSAGYTSEIIFGDGVSPSGEHFDAMQTKIRINHLAIVPRGRAKSTRIGDSADARWGASPINDRKDADMADAIQTRTVLIDGLSVVTTDAGAQALEKLTKQLSDAAAAMTAAEKKAEEEAAAKEKEMAKKDAEIADLKAKTLDATAIDALVKDRADLVARAKAIQPDAVTDGKSAADIKRAVVVAKRGDAVKDKADAYIDAAFDLLGDAEDPAKKALADASTARVGDAAQLADTAFNKSVADLNAWRKEA